MARCWRTLIDMRSFIIAFWLVSLLFTPVHALTLSKSPQHYSLEMQEYYLRPRPKILVEILPVFGRAGILANARKRMLIVGFMAPLVRDARIDLPSLAASAGDLPEARDVLAWIAHLAGCGEPEVIRYAGSKTLQEHILKMPQRLDAWDPLWEDSVVDMYWGAFMATGERVWLEGIIAAALEYASAGRPEAGRYAAATLYDYIPGNEQIAAAIRTHLEKGNPAHQDVLEHILANAAPK